jgi:hypothetical protein
MPVGVALVGLLIFLTGINTRPVDAGMIITGLAFAIPAIGIVLSRMRVAADHKGIEDKRATHDGRPLESDSDIPETLEEIIAEQEMYQPIWDAYLRAKRGEGGDMVEGMPLEADEVSFFVLRGEFFDPSKGLDSISGTVFVTNKRIVFDSIERSHEWPIAKLNRITLTGPGQRVFSVKGRSKKYGLLFPENVNDFDNAFGLALHLTNPQFSPEDPEPLMEEYFRKLAARRAELEAKNA